MVQLKKKAVLLIGAAMLFLGMGMNLQYALDDYGLADNNAVRIRQEREEMMEVVKIVI